MKVIFIGTYNESEILSGPEKVCKRVFEEYSKIDDTIFIQYFQDGRKYSYFKKLFGYEKTTEVNGCQVLKIGIVGTLFQIIKINPQIIHILSFDRFIVFIYLLKVFFRFKIYYMMNGIIKHENKYFNKEPVFTVIKNIIVENIVIYASDKIFYLSEFSKNILLRYYSPNKSKFSKTVNGLDSCFLNYPIKYSDKDPLTVVFIGNIDQQEKGFEFLINSLSSFPYKIKLFLIDSLKKVNKIRKYSNIDISIFDKMSPSEMCIFLSDKNIVVSPSSYDTFNISVLEAISCGLYPILTKQTGNSELLSDFVEFSSVDFGDKQKLSNEISKNLTINNNRIYKSLMELSWENIFQKYYLPHYKL
ncbi:MAG: glycosyltransferase [Candidatus Kapaibacterium sp.]